MRIQMIILWCAIFFVSCNEEDQGDGDISVIGKWKLIEVLADPGDGSGTFKEVKSNKTIELKSNGTITTNESLCSPYSDEIINEGTYSLKDKLIITNCQNSNIAKIFFEFTDDHLILNFVSNEGYSQKFQKVN
ncbi:Lipocalin-like protein [Tenacibaculum sp. 190130A14a]|uniref:Lipocalin-like protein n=1 Tax=Tenacibaculum polynesiense TaxID=3137857 RepID=A0ABM9P7Z4_9FLAO